MVRRMRHFSTRCGYRRVFRLGRFFASKENLYYLEKNFGIVSSGVTSCLEG